MHHPPRWVCSFGHSLLRQGCQPRSVKLTLPILSSKDNPFVRCLPVLPAARFFTSSPPAPSRDPSPESQIRDWLRRIKHDKWGWVIYRCTYSDDAAWARFKQMIEQ
ncbi:hypothetical protein QBC33DRAFT_547513 [Phialemonium atrogriseum]|uniref:Uncharacterized protein n=1 Tax=Phialemonium atrogriseum TaxID=1093897 RepID=A0AAJ0BTI4_9PEZI|nr:uncharacterized protein QBC33DRAFT_547513 [Phialemonium atrogriseum]KAK1764214.1 hypothetical protein QBC33DRAFT_547513 [Phialemonium atrogriseum]